MQNYEEFVKGTFTSTKKKKKSDFLVIQEREIVIENQEKSLQFKEVISLTFQTFGCFLLYHVFYFN